MVFQCPRVFPSCLSAILLRLSVLCWTLSIQPGDDKERIWNHSVFVNGIGLSDIFSYTLLARTQSHGHILLKKGDKSLLWPGDRKCLGFFFGFFVFFVKELGSPFRNYEDAEFSFHDDKIFMMLPSCPVVILPPSSERSPWPFITSISEWKGPIGISESQAVRWVWIGSFLS